MSVVAQPPEPEAPRELELWTAHDLAAALKVSAKTVQRLVLSGELPKPMHIGRQLRWHPAVVDDYLRRLAEEAQEL